MPIEDNKKAKIALLRRALQESLQGDFLRLNPERHYQFDWIEHKRVCVSAKYLYIKADVPFIADANFDEVTVECLDIADIEDLCQFVSKGKNGGKAIG
ncbi:MAG: hypothetical protein IJR02_00600 [Bacteroidaceae bacterium]|nr:hypothetical protein [Bacteroidaceae bacterium]